MVSVVSEALVIVLDVLHGKAAGATVSPLPADLQGFE